MSGLIVVESDAGGHEVLGLAPESTLGGHHPQPHRQGHEHSAVFGDVLTQDFRSPAVEDPLDERAGRGQPAVVAGDLDQRTVRGDEIASVEHRGHRRLSSHLRPNRRAKNSGFFFLTFCGVVSSRSMTASWRGNICESPVTWRRTLLSTGMNSGIEVGVYPAENLFLIESIRSMIPTGTLWAFSVRFADFVLTMPGSKRLKIVRMCERGICLPSDSSRQVSSVFFTDSRSSTVTQSSNEPLLRIWGTRLYQNSESGRWASASMI